MNSTEILKLLAAKPSRYLLLERAFPRGTLKRDSISLKEADGYDVEVTEHGGRFTPHIPFEMIDDFLRASLIVQDKSDESQDRMIFRISEDGSERARGLVSA
jgi:hypothetical protein